MRHTLAIVAVLLCCAVHPDAATAETLVIGSEDLDFHPYGKPVGDGEFAGYLPALLTAFAADRGDELVFEIMPLKRLFLEFGSGEIDMIVPDNPAWSQEYKEGIEIHYSDVVTFALDGFAVLPGRERETVGHDIVHVGTILGFTIEPLFDPAEREVLVFDRVSRFESAFGALFLGRVDAVYCNLAVTNDVLATLGKKPDDVGWSTALPRFKSPFHVSSTRRDLIAGLDDWLRSHPGKVRALQEEHGIRGSEFQDWGR